MKIKKVYSVGVCEEAEDKYGNKFNYVSIFADYDTLEEAEEHLKMLNDYWFIIERYISTNEIEKTDD